jgi:hypothetical protein
MTPLKLKFQLLVNLEAFKHRSTGYAKIPIIDGHFKTGTGSRNNVTVPFFVSIFLTIPAAEKFAVVHVQQIDSERIIFSVNSVMLFIS